MKRVDGIVGNINSDPALASAIADHKEADTLETVVLDDTERKRSRIRVTTDAGTDLGVLVDQPELTAGDVLIRNTDRAVIVAFEAREAFVIDFSTPQLAVSTAIDLGHRIGNQHWDIAVDDETIYIPVEADRAIIEEVLRPYIPAGATTYYETVDAEQFLNNTDKTSIATNTHNTSDTHGQSDQDHDESAHVHQHDHSHDYDHDHNHDSRNQISYNSNETDHDQTCPDADVCDDESNSELVSTDSLDEDTQ
ncbi:urease accessory protein UreE [Haloquadratum walsbyi]|uniref:Urease accessory protein UreE n=1 Tax=Haloquadratum walsbyi J07HQW2 TaxID=1238425 RepID=U1MZ55_9EURY|nr:urease accessory protein UreE [Haloquadratum walsbyi]ERG95799.1 MAG: urease accessory protein UreE [Haloquadratum walsbyi J07HQW2]